MQSIQRWFNEAVWVVRLSKDELYSVDGVLETFEKELTKKENSRVTDEQRELAERHLRHPAPFVAGLPPAIAGGYWLRKVVGPRTSTGRITLPVAVACVFPLYFYPNQLAQRILNFILVKDLMQTEGSFARSLRRSYKKFAPMDSTTLEIVKQRLSEDEQRALQMSRLSSARNSALVTHGKDGQLPVEPGAVGPVAPNSP
eukprot:GDKH01009575.1.p1 GENE.GDKH01009575.1~~GDKH01009575.1.p1  ORF type:complete len:200 (-),score=8.08 GDKH01009575.1:160-759(-)